MNNLLSQHFASAINIAKIAVFFYQLEVALVFIHHLHAFEKLRNMITKLIGSIYITTSLLCKLKIPLRNLRSVSST